MTTPENWTLRPDAPASGPAVVLDLDGVISDATHRQSYLRRSPQDWRGFFLASADDPVIETGRALAGSIDADHAVVILTARPSYTADATAEWLVRNEVRHDLLITRPAGDRRSSPDYKRDEIAVLEAAGFDVELAIDDDIEIVKMYRGAGVFAMYTHSGYYEHRDGISPP